jgi:hypothetical protein
MALLKDITGRRFGRWVAQWPAGISGRKINWLCLCDCGNFRAVVTGNLVRGASKSCGCLNLEVQIAKIRKVSVVTHGHTRNRKMSREYNSYQAMLRRCTKSNYSRFKSWGGKGITVCDRWRHSFENFLADMGPRPIGKTLDRFPDPYGNYEPSNCRWATPKEQASNWRKE